jgi:glycosyltransferase involved in cell wall biosynthesis
VNVAFVYDGGNADGTKGGAELAMEEFAATCPAAVAITDLDEAEVVVVGNCVTIPHEITDEFKDRRVIRFHHDLARHEHPALREWLDTNAEHAFTSPMHRARYSIAWRDELKDKDWPLVPPCPNLSRFKPNRETRRRTKREGAVSVAAWQNAGKGGHLVHEWARENETRVDVYGPGAYIPAGPFVVWHGNVPAHELPGVLQRYETFVFLPTAVEPFGRCVAEAWAAGCEPVTNKLVGVNWWIENEPDSLFNASSKFWEVVCG